MHISPKNHKLFLNFHAFLCTFAHAPNNLNTIYIYILLHYELGASCGLTYNQNIYLIISCYLEKLSRKNYYA